MKSAIVYMPNFNLLRKLWSLLNIDELWDNFSNFLVLYFPLHKISGSVLVNDFWIPPSYQFCTWPFIFQQIYYYLFFCYLGLG